jgi:capsular polysaccharide biosynthesis protein
VETVCDLCVKTAKESAMSAQELFASLEANMNQTKDREASLKDENRRLKSLSAIQDALLKKQRDALQEVTKGSSELEEVEKKRKALKEQLTALRTKILVSASESAELAGIVEQSLSGRDPMPIAAGPSGSIALRSIESIQQGLFHLVDSALKSDDLSVSAEDMSALIQAVSDVIAGSVDRGVVQESLDDAIKRQTLVIASLIPPPTQTE